MSYPKRNPPMVAIDTRKYINDGLYFLVSRSACDLGAKSEVLFN